MFNEINKKSEAKKRLDLVTIGQASLDVIENDLGITRDLLGGAAVYVAIVASSLGLRTGLVTNVGHDFNANYLKLLRDVGIDFSGIHQKLGLSSQIHLYYEGDNLKNYTVFEGVGSTLNVSDVPMDFISTRVMHIAPAPYQTQVLVAELMKKNGAIVSFDPHADFNNFPFENIKKILCNVDIFISNESELLSITGDSSLDSATTRIKDAGPSLVIVTKGANGAIITYENNKTFIPALKPLKPPEDYVGAGDAFVAGFLTGLCKSMSLSSCGLLAAAAASCIIQDFGLKYIPTLEAVQQILRSNGIHIPEWSDFGTES